LIERSEPLPSRSSEKLPHPERRGQRQSQRDNQQRQSENIGSDQQNTCQRQSTATIIRAKRGHRLHPDRRSLPIQIVALQLGAPGVSLPVLDDGGLPLGLQVLGFPQGDADVFAVAGWIDDALRG
jgi:Asp-tRNA(Asn)/Glu-tRNA(Gln) amidotransferase A subunit family amidase